MEKSNHKNYVEWFDRNRPKLVENVVLPNEKAIFQIFSKKFEDDAIADIKRDRVRLWVLWQKCADACLEIHNILSWEVENDPKLKEIVRNIVNLDYDSLKEVFFEIQKKYSNPEIQKHLQDICNYIDKMRQISKKHTNVIWKS